MFHAQLESFNLVSENSHKEGINWLMMFILRKMEQVYLPFIHWVLTNFICDKTYPMQSDTLYRYIRQILDKQNGTHQSPYTMRIRKSSGKKVSPKSRNLRFFRISCEQHFQKLTILRPETCTSLLPITHRIEHHFDNISHSSWHKLSDIVRHLENIQHTGSILWYFGSAISTHTNT